MMNENIEPDVNGDTLPGMIVDENTGLTLAEISRACAVHAEMVMEMVAEGLLMPEGNEPQFWRFTSLHLRRANQALRLQHDLGVNLAGAALALQLLDELEILRSRNTLEDDDE